MSDTGYGARVEGVDPPLAPRERAAQRLLALRALETLLKDTAAKIRREDGAAFDRAGQREVAELPDGTPLGNVRADPGTPAGWKITDEPAFRAWVEASGFPGLIVEKTVVTREVEPSYAAEMLADADLGTFINPATGEEMSGPPPGVTYRPAGPPSLKVTGDKAAPAAVARLLGDALRQLGITA